MLKVAVIIINYNTSKYTVACIESILAKTPDTFNFKIYVVDNNSAKEDYFYLKNYFDQKSHPKVSVHRNKINKGFGGGNMLGIQYAEPSEYVAFINNDTLFLNNCLSELYHFITHNKTAGIVGGQSYNEHEKEIISFDHYATTTRQIFGRKFLELIDSKKYPRRKKSYNQSMKVNTVSGSFMLVDRDSFNEIGGFDENLFLYYEETDVCLRLKNIGKDCYFVPSAKYLHYHGISTEHSDRIKKELKISLVYLVQKHFGCLSKNLLLIYLIFTTFFASIIKPRKWSFLLLYLQGAPLSKSLKTQQKITEI